ncbi:thiolase family protein [Alphaproteobacteria bacterium]|nr:thiolase family protein [Alphaproteobacteria bacterium]
MNASFIEPSPRLRDRCAIVGTATSKLGKVPGRSAIGLLEDAMTGALDDAGLTTSDVDGLLVRGPDEIYTFHQVVGERLGIDARFSTTLTNGGASQVMGVALAAMAIDAGLASCIVVGYGRDNWSRVHANKETHLLSSGRPPQLYGAEFGPELGYYGAIAAHAFGAQRHMHEYGTTREQFGAIAVAFREHALRNPDATMKKSLSMDDYHAGRMIVSPFGLFDCSLQTDAAGAVVVTSAEEAKDLRQRPVLIKGFGTHNNLSGWFNNDNLTHTGAIEAGKTAYAMAGVGPDDMDFAQIYDCFTYMVLVQLEDYGFCKKGEGGEFVASGALRLDGALPTNTSGGQLSEAHVEGMLQIVEGVRQLQGKYSPDRQVKDAELGLISGHGGNTVCESTLILGTG